MPGRMSIALLGVQCNGERLATRACRKVHQLEFAVGVGVRCFAIVIVQLALAGLDCRIKKIVQSNHQLVIVGAEGIF